MSITFGTTSTLLKLTGLRDTELGNAIWETLFYLELLTLGAEATASILVNLRRSAGKILKYEEALRKTATTTEEAADIDRVIREMQEIAGMAEDIGIRTTMTVEEFQAGLKRLSNIKPEEAFEHLDEAMKYFNHHVVDGRIVQISDTNCVNVVEAVEEFLSTGKIRIVEPSKIQDIFKLEKIYKRSFLQYKIPSLKNVMNEGREESYTDIRGRIFQATCLML
ncbi:hypothetical protein AAEO56_12635 [Flavobacterium sp. DGU11]|uniref:Uncharacterized protein n=1 Tax=Flavobacterium arundinis TaxID=3139143 RepID=A0ABU9HY74_9FLAO